MDMELAPTPAFRKMSESIAESVSDDPLDDLNVSHHEMSHPPSLPDFDDSSCESFYESSYRLLKLLLIFASDYYIITVNNAYATFIRNASPAYALSSPATKSCGRMEFLPVSPKLSVSLILQMSYGNVN